MDFFRKLVRLLGRGDQLRRKASTFTEETLQTSVYRGAFEPTILVFERMRIFRGLGRAATVFGSDYHSNELLNLNTMYELNCVGHKQTSCISLSVVCNSSARTDNTWTWRRFTIDYLCLLFVGLERNTEERKGREYESPCNKRRDLQLDSQQVLHHCNTGHVDPLPSNSCVNRRQYNSRC
jgi:hypothetical protein